MINLMSLEINLPSLDFSNPYFHLFTISFIYFITWIYTIRGQFLIDDQEGIARFSDRLEKDKLIDSYEHDENGQKTKYKNLQFNPGVKLPGSIIRWLRLHIGKKFTVIGKNSKGHEVYGYIQDPKRHHVLSIIVQYANLLLIYFFLTRLFGSGLAFKTTLLFSVFPLACQCVAWISGIGYLLCLLGATGSFLVSSFVPGLWVSVPLVLILSIVSSYGLFSGAFNWIIFLVLGDWIHAGVSFSVFLFSFLQFGRGFVDHRVKEFKKQNMGGSTVLNIRKPIVMVKTLWYYFCLTIFPKRLGLFHKWGYHYEPKIERFDWMFFKGALLLVFLLVGIFQFPAPVSFGIIWWITYLLVFSNFITAMQFVVDRYAFISSIGFCLILAYLTNPYPAVFGTILGIYMMRTWVHLPTFNDLPSFYESNVFNFPDSEVALGNLGVTLMGIGNPGSAVDKWNKAAQINPHYDVPHYNLYSIFKTNGMLDVAEQHLEKCLNSKVVHFREHWEKELKQLRYLKRVKRPLTQQMEEINECYRTFQSWEQTAFGRQAPGSYAEMGGGGQLGQVVQPSISEHVQPAPASGKSGGSSEVSGGVPQTPANG